VQFCTNRVATPVKGRSSQGPLLAAFAVGPHGGRRRSLLRAHPGGTTSEYAPGKAGRSIAAVRVKDCRIVRVTAARVKGAVQTKRRSATSVMPVGVPRQASRALALHLLAWQCSGRLRRSLEPRADQVRGARWSGLKRRSVTVSTLHIRDSSSERSQMRHGSVRPVDDRILPIWVNHASRQSGSCPILAALLFEVTAGTLDCGAVGLSPRPEQV
jgi:hypothetical protein